MCIIECALLDCYAISLLALFACRQSVSLYGLQTNPGCFPKFHKGEMFVVNCVLLIVNSFINRNMCPSSNQSRNDNHCSNLR